MGLDEFDPNGKGDKQLKLWASYIPNRSPKFKVHKTEGHAKNALAYYWPHREGIMYESVDGEWVERDRAVFPTTCVTCDGPLSPRRYYRHGHDLPRAFLSNEQKDLPAYKKPRECDDCNETRTGYSWG